MSELVADLRAMARAEHDDVSIASDAADEIERLREGINAPLVWEVIDIRDRLRSGVERAEIYRLLDNLASLLSDSPSERKR